MVACPRNDSVSYASVIVALDDQPVATVVDGKEFLSARASIQGAQPVQLHVRTRATSAAAKALQAKAVGDRLIVSGDVSLTPEGTSPVITASVVCDAHPDQYLNEVVIVGRIGSESRIAESGKSAKRSIAVNRYIKKSDSDEPVELTDWYGVRAFGFTKQRLEAADKGALVQVAGTFDQLLNAKQEAFCEIKARSIRVHKGRKGGAPNPASGTAAAGYDQQSFMGSEDDIASDWD
jgi:single-stranded DNA-binding protein